MRAGFFYIFAVFGRLLLSLKSRPQKGLSQGLGGDPEQASGVLRKVALVGEAYRYGDFMEGKLCIGQEFLRALYALADDVLVWREARRALESPREMVRAHMCYPSELVEGKVVDQIVSYVVHHASERAL